jgi:predicted transcriptional regulator
VRRWRRQYYWSESGCSTTATTGSAARLLEEKQRQLDAQQKQIEELADALDKLKNRSSKNSLHHPVKIN